MSEQLLKITDLCAGVAEKQILKNLSLTVNEGEVHAIMGPNGAGKSTLSNVLTGKFGYEITGGTIEFKGKNLLELKPEERAGEGIFLCMQYPVEISGVSVNNFLKHAVNAVRKYRGEKELDAAEFLKLLKSEAKKLNIAPEMLKRELNVGFSGGEKKRLETLQMSLLQPSLAILDEADSGLDIDALKMFAEGVNSLRNQHNSLLIITHHINLLDYINPDFVHIYADGRIIKSGGKELAEIVEKNGYGEFLQAVE